MLNIREAIFQAVTYADIFNYPLTAPEIHRYLPGCAASFVMVDEILRQEKYPLSYQGGLYTLPGREALADIRRQREKIATLMWPQALHYGKMISSLPFVRMVAITGGLAMNNVEPNADIDYLIVTEPGHIWLTRAQVLLLGRYSTLRGATLCPNYLVSLRTLVFPDQTLYVAHEVAQMIPVAGLDVYDEIRRKNAWVHELLPNAEGVPASPFMSHHTVTRSISHPMLEMILRTPPFRRLEKWEMERKIRRLECEQNISAESTFSVDVCKGHLHRHQFHTDRALDDRLRLSVNK
jgi:hypothetical protein